MIDNKKKVELTLKQKSFLFFYRFKRYLNYKCLVMRNKGKRYIDSFYFYLILFVVSLFISHEALLFFNVTVEEKTLHSLAFAIASIIGVSIAIIFSFSTFILQSTADLFSTQYLNKFIENVKEKVFFWLLVFLTIASFFTSICLENYILEVLIGILLIAFYLIYNLYKELRKRINPEVTLIKIRDDAINQLEKINKELKKLLYVQNKIFADEKKNNEFSLDVYYKANPNWNIVVLENVKYLFEIGLRLLAKNEINSSNLTVKYISDIYLKHLTLRNGHFIRVPVSLWGNYSFDDEGFSTKILEYLQSMGNRIIKEERKENVYYLLNIYKNILTNSLNIDYADKTLETYKGNPLLSLILAHYIRFLENLLTSKENDWVWEAIKSVSSISKSILQKTDNYFIFSQINQIIDKFSMSCLKNNNEAFLRELINIYFNQIWIAWNRYEDNDILWKDIFKNLKKNIILLTSASSNLSLLLSELFIIFHKWQTDVVNEIIKLKDKNEKKEHLDKFIQLLERWSDFLLDFARDFGLQNSQVGLPIIQSVDNNLNIIHAIHNKFDNLDMEEIYRTQFYTLSWYFQKTDKLENSFIFNFEEVLEIFLREISHNLKQGNFDIKYLIDLYVRLIEEQFEKVDFGYGYNHPRVIKKLVYLGLFLHKYKVTEVENNILTKIDELNKKYLELNKEHYGLKEKKRSLIGSDEFQLCKELHDLENDLFSYNTGPLIDIEDILKEEITKDEWIGFTKKISHCKNIEYRTRQIF